MILAHQHNRYSDVWSNTKAIMFLGTPHRGSPYASYGKILGNIANMTLHASLTHRFIGGVRTPLIKTLTRESRELEAISEDFDSIAQESELAIISLYETEAHPFINRTVNTPTLS